MHQRKEAAN